MASVALAEIFDPEDLTSTEESHQVPRSVSSKKLLPANLESVNEILRLVVTKSASLQEAEAQPIISEGTKEINMYRLVAREERPRLSRVSFESLLDDEDIKDIQNDFEESWESNVILQIINSSLFNDER